MQQLRKSTSTRAYVNQTAKARMELHDSLPEDLRAVSNEYGLKLALSLKAQRTVEAFDAVFADA